MFGKLMNRYYYGKSGKGDYTPEDLPKNRWQLFWEMLRVRFSSLVKLNLLYMLAWIPVMIVLGLGITAALSQLTEVSTVMMQVEAGEALQSDLDAVTGSMRNSLLGLLSTTLLLLWPAVAITGPFTCGVCYVTRNWARDEHSFMMSDYWQAVKENWKTALPCSIITGVVPFMMYVCISFYGQMAKQNMFFIVPEILTIMMGLLWMCATLYMYPQMVTYKLNLRGIIRNSFLMTLGRLPHTAGIKLLSILPTVILLAVLILFGGGNVIVISLLIYAAYYIVVGFALSRFVAASFTNGVFDLYLNSKIEGAQTGRGLYVETDDDSDENENEMNHEDMTNLQDSEQRNDAEQ